MGSEWKNKNKKGRLSGVGWERGSDGAVSLALPLWPPQRVPLGAPCPVGFYRFSGHLHALEVRDLLLPAGKWKPHQRISSVLIPLPSRGESCSDLGGDGAALQCRLRPVLGLLFYL